MSYLEPAGPKKNTSGGGAASHITAPTQPKPEMKEKGGAHMDTKYTATRPPPFSSEEPELESTSEFVRFPPAAPTKNQSSGQRT